MQSPNMSQLIEQMENVDHDNSLEHKLGHCECSTNDESVSIEEAKVNGHKGGPGDPGVFFGKSKQHKRKKSKKKSNHIPNCKSKTMKPLLGAAILSMLGKAQTQASDARKRELLKEMPLADFVETVGGKQLPEYQKRLLNMHQQRHESSFSNEPDFKDE